MFVNSMSDPGSAEWPAPDLPWPANVWVGVSVENTDVADRVDELREVQAAVRFLSCEPLLGPLHDLDLDRVGWVIAGGESGPGARPMDPAWPARLRDACQTAGVPYFFTQWGGTTPKTWRTATRRAHLGRDARPPGGIDGALMAA